MPPINPNATIRMSDAALAADVNGETMIMDPEAGKYYGLNGAASMIWRRLQQETTPAHLVAELIAQFDGPADVIEAETMDLLRMLLNRNLLVVSGPPA